MNNLLNNVSQKLLNLYTFLSFQLKNIINSFVIYLQNVGSTFFLSFFFIISLLNLGAAAKYTLFAASVDNTTQELLEKVLALQQLQASQIEHITQSMISPAISAAVPVVVEEVSKNTWVPFVATIVVSVSVGLIVFCLYDLFRGGPGAGAGAGAESSMVDYCRFELSALQRELNANVRSLTIDVDTLKQAHGSVAESLRVLNGNQAELQSAIKLVNKSQGILDRNQVAFFENLQNYIQGMG